MAFSVSEYSALRAGIFKASIRPPGYPSARLRPRRACFRFTRQEHCSCTTSIRLNFRLARDTTGIGNRRRKVKSKKVKATPQGAVASPLIANVYLHYLFDLWADVWRRKVAQGDVIVVRYADDLVVGFQHRTEAERFLKEFR